MMSQFSRKPSLYQLTQQPPLPFVLRIGGCLAVAIAVACAASAISPKNAIAQPYDESNQAPEYIVKLAFLCNFCRYVEWPSNAVFERNDAWIIGILGKPPFQGALNDIIASERKIQGRVIEAHYFDSIDEYRPCHIFFIANNVPADQQQAAIQTMRGKPVLLIGETPDFTTLGGCLNFYLDQENVRFEVNRAAVSQHGLKISSKLLGIAKIVDGN